MILSHNYKFISRVGFTNNSTSVLRRIIISLASWQLPLQPAEPLSTIATTGATSNKSHWISLKTLIQNHPSSTITVTSIPTSITTYY